jgi:hypothetical protein
MTGVGEMIAMGKVLGGAGLEAVFASQALSFSLVSPELSCQRFFE